MFSSEAGSGAIRRRFAVLGHEATTAGDFHLNDLAGSAGRLDILVRCVTSAFMLSHDLRRDTELYLVLLGPPQPPKTVRLVGPELRYLNPDERSTAALLRRALRSRAEGKSSPGIYVSRRGLPDLLARLGEGLIYLHEDGEDIRRASLPSRSAFLLSDHRNLTAGEAALVEKAQPQVVRVGPRTVHANHAIVLVHNELDRQAARPPEGPD
ncbi:MAG: tRNA (pseudouridine(54)-N(1))-methyltransferase TrmY [Thermoplasmata archaeon]